MDGECLGTRQNREGWGNQVCTSSGEGWASPQMWATRPHNETRAVWGTRSVVTPLIRKERE